MKITLDIRMNNTEGALERILSRLRQRAFSVCNMSADRSTDHCFIDARITVESSRPVELAARQIEKLFDVIHVKFNEVAHVEPFEAAAARRAVTLVRERSVHNPH